MTKNKKEAKNPSANGMSTPDMPDLGGPQGGQTPYRVPQQKPSSASAPSSVGIQNPLPDTGVVYTSRTSQTPYESDKRDKNTNKKPAANGTSRGFKY
ncbi:unnamed protein product [Urochloa humidicola]